MVPHLAFVGIGADLADGGALGRIGYADHADILHIARSGRHLAGGNNLLQHSGGNRIGFEFTDGTVRECGLQGGLAVHGLLLWRMVGKDKGCGGFFRLPVPAD